MTQYGGHKSLFLLIFYNFKNIGGGGGGTWPPLPYSAVFVGAILPFPLQI